MFLEKAIKNQQFSLTSPKLDFWGLWPDVTKSLEPKVMLQSEVFEKEKFKNNVYYDLRIFSDFTQNEGHILI